MINKKIVLFGCDNSGKTTLANTIATWYNCNDSYLKPLGPAGLDKQVAYIDKNLIKNELIVFDRFPIIEEEVCGQVFRGRSNFDSVPKSRVDFYLGCIDLFIFCNPSLTSIINWGDREQMNGVKENVIPLISGYMKVFLNLKTHGYNVVEWNWEKDRQTNFEELIRRIEK